MEVNTADFFDPIIESTEDIALGSHVGPNALEVCDLYKIYMLLTSLEKRRRVTVTRGDGHPFLLFILIGVHCID